MYDSISGSTSLPVLRLPQSPISVQMPSDTGIYTVTYTHSDLGDLIAKKTRPVMVKLHGPSNLIHDQDVYLNGEFSGKRTGDILLLTSDEYKFAVNLKRDSTNECREVVPLLQKYFVNGGLPEDFVQDVIFRCRTELEGKPK